MGNRDIKGTFDTKSTRNTKGKWFTLRAAARLGAAGLMLALLTTGCGQKNAGQSGGQDSSAAGNAASGQSGGRQSGFGQSAETVITGSGTAVSVSGDGAAASGSVVTISRAGTYRLSGTLADGQIVVDAGKEDEVKLILDGFSIANSTTSPIYGVKSGLLTIYLEEGTENSVSDGTAYVYESAEEDEPNAAIFSKDDLVLEGEGALTVQGNYQEGIRGKDALTVKSGTYVIQAVNDGIKGKDSVEIEGGTFTITAGGDGIQASNDTEADKGTIAISGGTFSIAAGKKGVLGVTAVGISGGTFEIESEDDAVHCNGDVTIAGGTFTISTGDDAIHGDQQVVINDGTIDVVKSYEGIEGLSIDINGGTIRVESEDDGLNAAGGNDSSGNGGRMGDHPFATTEGAYIKITGGSLWVAANGDGIDSNGDFIMEGGTVFVEGPVSDGDGTLDYNGTGTITGGTFAGSGSSGMLQSFSEQSSQPVLVIYYEESQTAGTKVTVTDVGTGTESGGSEQALFSVTPSKEFSSMIISLPELNEGGTYEVQTGEAVTEITVSGTINQSGTPSGRGGFGMGRGGGRMPEGGASENGVPGDGTLPAGGAPGDGIPPEGGGPEGGKMRGGVRQKGADSSTASAETSPD